MVYICNNKETKKTHTMKIKANNPKPFFCNQTGLAYIKEVPFTHEAIDALFDLFMAAHASKPKNPQFEIITEVTVTDNVNEGEVKLNFADVSNLQDLAARCDVASDKDFEK